MIRDSSSIMTVTLKQAENIYKDYSGFISKLCEMSIVYYYYWNEICKELTMFVNIIWDKSVFRN